MLFELFNKIDAHDVGYLLQFGELSFDSVVETFFLAKGEDACPGAIDFDPADTSIQPCFVSWDPRPQDSWIVKSAATAHSVQVQA